MKNAPITKSNESTKNQVNYSIAITGKDEPRIDSRLIAGQLGIRHKNVISNIEKYKPHFKAFGILAFKTEVIRGKGQPEKYALLNEDQTYFLLSLSRNTEKVVSLKARLVQAFKEARQAVNIHKTEYLPSYHQLHDEIARLAEGSINERFIHMNVNKAINQAVGVESGNRNRLPLPNKAMLIVAQSVASNAIANANNNKDGYQAAKQALQGLRQAVEVNS